MAFARDVKVEHRQLAYGVALSLAILSAASLTSIAYSANAPLIRLTFGLSEVEVGAIASCIYIGAAASSISSGRLTDSLGAGPVLAMSMLALAVGCAISAVAPVAPVFFAGLLIAGLGYGAVNPPTNVLANPSDPRRRALSMSIKQSGIPLGGIAAGFLVPFAAEATDWRWSLLIPIVICAVLVVVSARLNDARASATDEIGDAAGRPAIRLPSAYAYGFLMAGVQVSIFVFLAVYLVDERAFDVAGAGAGLALLLVGGLVGRPAWGWISDRMHHDRIRILQVAAMLSAGFLAVLTVVGGPAVFPVLLGIGFCAVGWNGVYLAMVTEAASADLIGSTTGVALVLVNLGAVVLPPLLGLVVAVAEGWWAAWIICAGITLACVVILQAGRGGLVRASATEAPANAA